MKVVYKFGKKVVSGKADNTDFILSNNTGSYLFLSENPASRYQGFFFIDDFRMFKTVENIELLRDDRISEIIYDSTGIKRKRKNISEGFFIYNNSLIYELNKKSDVVIYLDVKESYDNDEWGRFYEISEERGKVIVKFTKKQGGKEKFTVYIAIKLDRLNYKKTNEWIKREYKLDEKRNSPPSERHVYSPLRLSIKKMVVSCSRDKSRAVKESDFVYKNYKKLKKGGLFKPNQKIKNSELNIAYNCARNSLNNLYISTDHTKGVFAGLPWFFQFWNRDEFISLKALISIGKEKEAKDILLNQLNGIKTNGRMLNRYPDPVLEAADAAGWLFLRILDLSKMRRLSKKEKGVIKEKLEFCIESLIRNYSQKGLIYCNKKESWMDTIDRRGFNIEIQALQLCMYRLLHSLNGGKFSKYLEERMKRDVRKNFWNGKVLLDNLGEKVIRPNVFIAAYAYPELLTKGEWIRCFERVLPSLWLDWGGLSSVDKESPLFISHHTGENNYSYHSGDSWFFLNNMAAVVMHRIDKFRFKDYIAKILEASTKEILWKGAIGGASELSSAKSLQSGGCPLQAWSLATYIELIEEIF